jgi:hypothetical protein
MVERAYTTVLPLHYLRHGPELTSVLLRDHGSLIVRSFDDAVSSTELKKREGMTGEQGKKFVSRHSKRPAVGVQ